MPHTVFIHGLSNKPEQDHLLKLYKRKLAHEDGPSFDDIGIDSALVYWADVLYPSPDTDLAAYESVGSDELIQATVEPSVTANVETAEEAAFVAKLTAKLQITDAVAATVALTDAERNDLRHERIPLPGWLRDRLMAKLVRDAHLYFFNKEFSPRPGVTYRVRDELRRRFVESLKAVKAERRPTVVLSHSMGTFIAYDCLMHEPDCPAIDGFMTVGSPMGLDEVQDHFEKWTRDDGFPSEKLKGKWINVFDRLDPVCGADPKLANDYKQKGKAVIEDVEVTNQGTWRHGISQYLQRSQLRAKLASLLQVEWA